MHLSVMSAQVEEVSALYAERFGIRRDSTWFLLKLHEELGELTQCFLMATGQARTRGRSEAELAADLRAEMADVLCHLLLLARHHGVDLDHEVDRKWLSRLRS